MKVSIVIPTLNEEKILGKSLNSIANQSTGQDVELIIVDSYSTDRTLEIAREFTKKIYSVPPGIIGRARQKGSEMANGEIIISAGADNIYDKNWLDELIAPIALKNNVASAGKLLPLEGNFIENSFSEYFLSPAYCMSLKLGIPLIAGESMAFSKDAFSKVHGYNLDLVTHEDTDLFKRLMGVGKVSFCPKSITYVSTRRIRKWGYAKYLWFHGSNFFTLHFFGKSHQQYEAVR